MATIIDIFLIFISNFFYYWYVEYHDARPVIPIMCVFAINAWLFLSQGQGFFFGEKALANGVYWNAYLIEIAYNEFMSFNKKEIKELN